MANSYPGRNLSRALVLLALYFLLPALCVGQKAELSGWRGTTWGMSPAELESRFPGEIVEKEEPRSEPGLVTTSEIPSFEFLGREFAVEFFFSTEDGGLRKIYLLRMVTNEFDSDRFEKNEKYKAEILDLAFEPGQTCLKVEDLLRSTYGEPTLTRDANEGISSEPEGWLTMPKTNEWHLPTTKIQSQTMTAAPAGAFCSLTYESPSEKQPAAQKGR